MSPTAEDHKIIDALIGTYLFSPVDQEALKEIRNKPAGRCTAKDADIVARIVRKALRKLRV